MARSSAARSILALGGVVLLTLLLRAAEPEKKFSADEAAFFEKEVAPILEARCVKCHGGEKVRGGLRLTTREHVLKGGTNGPVFSPEKPNDSKILRAINYLDGLEMPPKEKLSAKELATLTRWMKMGLPWTPGKVLTVAAAAKGGVVTEESKNYWCYKPLKRPAVPAVKDRAWVRNPIDAFLLAKLEANGLTPAPPADRIALVRRATYDLTGLPPTPEQVDAFVNDSLVRCLGKVDRSTPRFAAVRREVGPPLARRGALRRDQRLRARRRQAVRLALPRLRHQELQRRQAVRPVHPRTVGRRRDARLSPRRGHRHRVLPPRPVGRRAGRPAAGALRRVRRSS